MFNIKSYQYKLDNWKLKKQKLNEIIDKINFYQDKNSNLLTNYGNDNNYEADVIQILKEDIIKFFIEANLYNPCVSSLWFQQYNNEQCHLTHNHGALGYSSVLYVNYQLNVVRLNEKPFNMNNIMMRYENSLKENFVVNTVWYVYFYL